MSHQLLLLPQLRVLGGAPGWRPSKGRLLDSDTREMCWRFNLAPLKISVNKAPSLGSHTVQWSQAALEGVLSHPLCAPTFDHDEPPAA